MHTRVAIAGTPALSPSAGSGPSRAFQNGHPPIACLNSIDQQAKKVGSTWSRPFRLLPITWTKSNDCNRNQMKQVNLSQINLPDYIWDSYYEVIISKSVYLRKRHRHL